MKERTGKLLCFHRWVYDGFYTENNPTTYHKICRKCGRVKHELGKHTDKKWFREIYYKFYEVIE